MLFNEDALRFESASTRISSNFNYFPTPQKHVPASPIFPITPPLFAKQWGMPQKANLRRNLAFQIGKYPLSPARITIEASTQAQPLL
jgi:hypothetical protein